MGPFTSTPISFRRFTFAHYFPAMEVNYENASEKKSPFFLFSVVVFASVLPSYQLNFIRVHEINVVLMF